MDVLCVAAHPDDEVLGVGGTLAKHAAEGDRVEVLLLSDGAMARFEEETEAARERRQERRTNAQWAGTMLGAADVTVLDYWGNQLDDVPLLEVVREIEAKVAACEPDVVYTHHYGDLNVDHQLVARATRTATRPTAASPVDRVLCFETPSASEWGMETADTAFQPTAFVDVSDHLDVKMDAIGVYEEEMRERPHPRNPESLRERARQWGDRSGVPAAEAFEVLLERHR